MTTDKFFESYKPLKIQKFDTFCSILVCNVSSVFLALTSRWQSKKAYIIIMTCVTRRKSGLFWSKLNKAVVLLF